MERQPKLTAEWVRSAARELVLLAFANSLAGGLVGVAIALFSGEAGALARFVPIGILFANVIGFAAGFSARFVLPRYGNLPAFVRIPLAIITLLAGGAFGSVLVIMFNPVFVLYQGRLTLLLVLVDSAIAVVVGLIIYNYERMQGEIEAGYGALAENRVREERLKELAARSELKALKAQINPHFLFNALNSISALISIDPAAAQSTLERVAGIFRGTLLASEKESVLFSEEMKLVNAYLDIERARFGARLAVVREIEPQAEDVAVPPLILQPVVENAVRHGISPKVGGGRLVIEARVRGGLLEIAVSDDGVGIERGRLGDVLEQGYGLRNVRDRLAARYGKGNWFKIERGDEGGTRVEIVIPVPGAAAPGV